MEKINYSKLEKLTLYQSIENTTKRDYKINSNYKQQTNYNGGTGGGTGF